MLGSSACACQSCVQFRQQIMLLNGRHDMPPLALLPKCAAAPTALLQDSTKAHLSAMLSGNCYCRCMHKFKTRSALVRHLEYKLTDCPVAADAGGLDVPRSVLLDIAQKRVYVRWQLPVHWAGCSHQSFPAAPADEHSRCT